MPGQGGGGAFHLQVPFGAYNPEASLYDPNIPPPPRDAVDNPDLAWVCGRVMQPLQQHEVGKKHGWTVEQWLSADNRAQVAAKPMYYNHKSRSVGAIGSLHSPYVDSENWLCVCGYINRTDERAADVYQRMLSGEVCDLSIGYDVEFRNAVGHGQPSIARIIIREVSVTEKGKIKGSRITFLNSAVTQGDGDDTTITTRGEEPTTTTSQQGGAQGSSLATKAASDWTSLLNRYRQRHTNSLFTTTTSTMATPAVQVPSQPSSAAAAAAAPLPSVTTGQGQGQQQPPAQQQQQQQQQQQAGDIEMGGSASDSGNNNKDTGGFDLSQLTDIDPTNHEQVVQLAFMLLQDRKAKEEAATKAFVEQNQALFQQVAPVLKAHGLSVEDDKTQAFFVDRSLAHLNQPALRLAQRNLSLESELAKMQEEKRVLEETVRGLNGAKRANTARQGPAVAANAARAALEYAQNTDALPSNKPQRTALAQTTAAQSPAPTTPQEQASDMRKLAELLQKRAATLPRIAADAHVGAYHPLDPYRIEANKVLDLTKESGTSTVSVRNSALVAIEDSILTPEMLTRAQTPFNPNAAMLMGTAKFQGGQFTQLYNAYKPGTPSPFTTTATSMETAPGNKAPVARGVKRTGGSLTFVDE